MKTSENISELALALATAQGSLKTAKKNSDNPFFHSKYADLSSVWDACREALVANDLAVTQVPSITDRGEMLLVTMLMHKSGEWISGEQLVSPAKANDPQALGSALTYFRRYGLSSVLGISFEGEDDDANAASTPAVPSSEPRREEYPSRNVDPDMMCPIHGVEWFQSEKMKAAGRPFAHKPTGNETDWCERSKVMAKLQQDSDDLTKGSTTQRLYEEPEPEDRVFTLDL
tara:strand:+ start:2033 stop:2722 length:690 start_codon:yes stop_codon:yes gene_type:complete